jgi:predicted RNA-binding Zn-ribbon protein involved in translation (DUF1610 family)
VEKLCELTVTVGGYNKPKEKSIISACMVEWCFRKHDFGFVKPECGRRRLLQASSMGTLYQCEEVGGIIERIESAVWRANGAICHVEVEAREYSRNLEPVSIPEEDAELQIA